jgi:hypothetical protein
MRRRVYKKRMAFASFVIPLPQTVVFKRFYGIGECKIGAKPLPNSMTSARAWPAKPFRQNQNIANPASKRRIAGMPKSGNCTDVA